MADLRVAKVVNPAGAAVAQLPKAAPSKFDLVRSQIAQKVAAAIKLPPMAQPSAPQVASIESGLKQQLTVTNARSAADFFQPGLQNTRLQMDKLTQAVGKLQPQQASSPLTDGLKALEQQFQDSGNLIQKMTDMDPKSLLNVQLQLYQLSENIGLMSKLVEQTSSGMKTVMQTQV
jgi:hypothetical protein